MKTASCKQKGRIAALGVRSAILNTFSELSADDIHTTSSGAPGRDLTLSPRAQSLFPFVVEVKCQEKLNIWDAMEQAKAHCREGEQWVLAFKRNRTELLATLPLNDLLALLRKVADK